MSEEEIKIGVFIWVCGTNIIGKIDVRKLSEVASTCDNVVIAREY